MLMCELHVGARYHIIIKCVLFHPPSICWNAHFSTVHILLSLDVHTHAGFHLIISSTSRRVRWVVSDVSLWKEWADNYAWMYAVLVLEVCVHISKRISIYYNDSIRCRSFGGQFPMAYRQMRGRSHQLWIATASNVTFAKDMELVEAPEPPVFQATQIIGGAQGSKVEPTRLGNVRSWTCFN